MKIISVVGARPNFMKIAPLISIIDEYNAKVMGGPSTSRTSLSKKVIDHILVHTGQHYDTRMSDAFFKDLRLPRPDIYLGVGSGTHAVQTAEIMKKFEEVLLEIKPDIVIVVGDVNSTLACALVASKTYYSSAPRPLVAHIEAGLRSFDRNMPEEMNRILTDHMSDLLFVTERSGMENLKRENIPEEKIFFVGNTMIDTLLKFQDEASSSKILNELGLVDVKETGIGRLGQILPYALLTLHRPSNVDDRNTFLNIIQAIIKSLGEYPIIFPAHPRTQNRIREFGLEKYFDYAVWAQNRAENADNISDGLNHKIMLINPLGYLDFLSLMKNAKVVLTDSGGIQEETTCLNVPCVTLRQNTERPVTVDEGTNIIAGTTLEGIVNSIGRQLNGRVKNGIPKYWDGRTASRILDEIIDVMNKEIPV